MCSKLNGLNGEQGGINIKLEQENQKLKQELKCIKEELKACMQKDLEVGDEGGEGGEGAEGGEGVEGGEGGEGGSKDSCASLKDSEKRTQMYYLEEINILSLQLRETFETMSKIENVNNQLNKELMKVRCQYRKLQDDLKTQRALDEFTFMQVEKALKDKQAGLFNKCQCLKAGSDEEGTNEEGTNEEGQPEESQPESEAAEEAPPEEPVEEVNEE